jgi:hypothetical protein
VSLSIVRKLAKTIANEVTSLICKGLFMNTTSMDYKNLSGIFRESDINTILNDLEMRQIPPEEISVMMSENTGEGLLKFKASNKAPEGATIGGLSGGIIGAIVGGLTLVGSVLAPGAGLLVAGPIIGALAGTAAGASAGGLLGGLIGMGIPEHEAKHYEYALQQEGNVLLAVRVHSDQADEIKSVFDRYNAKNVSVKS